MHGIGWWFSAGVPRKPWVSPHSRGSSRSYTIASDRQYVFAVLCKYVNRGSTGHWNASLGPRSIKKVKNNWYRHKRRRQGAAAPPQVGQKSVSYGQISERTIGNLGNFSVCFPALFDTSGSKFTAPLNLKSCAHGYWIYASDAKGKV